MCATMIVTFTMTSQSRELVPSVQPKLLQPSAQLSKNLTIKLWWWLRPLPGRWSPLSSLKCRSLLLSRRGTMVQKGEALHHTGQNLGHIIDCNWQCWSESFDCARRQPNDIAELREGGLLACRDAAYPHNPTFLNYRQDGNLNGGDDKLLSHQRKEWFWSQVKQLPEPLPRPMTEVNLLLHNQWNPLLLSAISLIKWHQCPKVIV